MKTFFKTAGKSFIALFAAMFAFAFGLALEYPEAESLILSVWAAAWYVIHLQDKSQADIQKAVCDQMEEEIEGLKQTVAEKYESDMKEMRFQIEVLKSK